MKRRLLIVEDDAALGRMLGWELEELGYEVTVTANCREALNQGKAFDLALLDYHLPDGDGIDLMQTLKRRTPGLAITLYSGQAAPEIRNLALERGAALFLSKPATARQLHRGFQSTLDGRANCAGGS